MTVDTCHTIADAATNRESFYEAPIQDEGPERRAAVEAGDLSRCRRVRLEGFEPPTF